MGTLHHLHQVRHQGRMKYCRTIFKALYRVAPALARRTFLENESFYHPIAASMIRKVRTSPMTNTQDLGL